jgi:hypothetical protein
MGDATKLVLVVNATPIPYVLGIKFSGKRSLNNKEEEDASAAAPTARSTHWVDKIALFWHAALQQKSGNILYCNSCPKNTK